ncbi:DnaJ-class molecular chaperone CbpA [Bacillus sp. ZZV12-4809]|nr:DnaJ-class molecular chaperone CbpA [Bacillus sp. ZZV12-4809]
MNYQYPYLPVNQEYVPHNGMYVTDYRVRPGFGIGRRPGFGFGRPGFPGLGLGLGFLGGLATGALLTPGPGFGYPYYYPYPPYPPYSPYYYY